MLTPALRELSRRHQVHLACDARWISLFRAHPALAAVEDFRGSLSPVARTIDLVRAVDFRGDHPRAEITDRINLFCEAAGVTPADRRPDLHLSSEAHAWADRFCRDLGDFALVQYRATSPFRTYSRMAEVCQQLLAHLPVVAVSDFPWPERPPVARDLCGTTAVENVAAVVGRAAVVVAPDSGCLHLAGAQGVPVVGLFGPYPPSLRLEHYAWKRALRAAPDCPPCFEDPVRCGQMPPPCLLGIDPAQVVREALALMRLRAQAR
jgi:ADP-heptose:LPS heptosyltransferase